MTLQAFETDSSVSLVASPAGDIQIILVMPMSSVYLLVAPTAAV